MGPSHYDPRKAGLKEPSLVREGPHNEPLFGDLYTIATWRLKGNLRLFINVPYFRSGCCCYHFRSWLAPSFQPMLPTSA